MKKLLINFVALRGGGTADAYQMTKALVENGCEVYAILSSNMENIKLWRDIPGIVIFEIKGYTTKMNFFPRLLKFLMFDLKTIKRKLKSVKIDAQYIPMISHWTYFIFKKFKSLRTVYTMHDVLPHDGKTNTLIWKQSVKIANACSDIVVLSECFKNDVIKTYNKKENHVAVIPLGNQPYYKKAETIDQSNDFEFVFYGRIEDYKGLDILAEAFRLLTLKRENVHLTIAGNGDFTKYQSLFDVIDKNKITIINRWIKDDEVSSFFNKNKSITLLPYKNATQSGIIPIAMGFRSLVISTNCSGLKEQIENNKTGFLIEPNNVNALFEKMEYVIDHWGDCGVIIENAFNYIGQLSWFNVSKRLIKLLDNE